MKKILLITACLILIAAIPSFAGIQGSKHDLTYVINSRGDGLHPMFINNYGEICVYCHTPHGGNSNAPLWNRNTPAYSPGAYTLYNSPSMENNPTTISPISMVCLSCHDGTIAVDQIINAPGAGDNPDGPWGPNAETSYHSRMGQGTAMSNPSYCGGCHDDSGFGGAPNRLSAYIGDVSPSQPIPDLSNDHPISMNYPSGNPYYNSVPNDPKIKGVKLLNGKVECASCHDVHDDTYAPFLRKDNTNSALCTTCHNK